MDRRRWRFALAALICGASVSGCESFPRRGNERNPDSPPPGWGASPEDSDVPEEARSQHKPTRSLGGWSSESNEIERSLGVR